LPGIAEKGDIKKTFFVRNTVHKSDDKILASSVEDGADTLGSVVEVGVSFGVSVTSDRSFAPFTPLEGLAGNLDKVLAEVLPNTFTDTLPNNLPNKLPDKLPDDMVDNLDAVLAEESCVVSDMPWSARPAMPVNSALANAELPATGIISGGDSAAQSCSGFFAEALPDDEPVNEDSALVLGVRFSRYGAIYFFKAGQDVVKPGGRVLVDTDQGVALAEVIITRRLRLPLPKIRMEDGAEVEIQVIKGLPGPEDIALASSNQNLAASARLFCKECIRNRNLDMKLVDVEVLHDRSKIIFYFTAPARIDFRDLIKDLVRNYHTRIELRQIGVRHETQMLGAVGNCGMTCCCRRYLRKFAPVTIKMAKEQNLFLNVAKLSGICGRLLCCLSYEQENYDEFHKRCPKIGKKFSTSKGAVKIMRANLFRQSIFIQDEAGQETELQLDDWELLHPVRFEPQIPESAPGKLKDADQPPDKTSPLPSAGKHEAVSDDLSKESPKESPKESSEDLPMNMPIDMPIDLQDIPDDAAGDKSVFGLPGSRYAENSARQPRDKNHNQHRRKH
jgi:cell fate regulator YaaT (PSP1 superfamily)